MSLQRRIERLEAVAASTPFQGERETALALAATLKAKLADQKRASQTIFGAKPSSVIQGPRPTVKPPAEKIDLVDALQQSAQATNHYRRKAFRDAIDKRHG